MKNVLPYRLVAALSMAAALPTLGAQASSQKGKEPSAAADMRMAAESAPYREVADAFIAAAISGNQEKVVGMLSPALVSRMGGEAIQRAMQGQILPFFASGNEIGRSVTIAGTTDANGNTGFAYYMWLIPKTGDKRPFTVYVVNEAGKHVVANIVPDRFVEGRHQ